MGGVGVLAPDVLPVVGGQALAVAFRLADVVPMAVQGGARCPGCAFAAPRRGTAGNGVRR